MQEIVWFCSFCAEKGRKEDTLELKLFKRYVYDSVHIKGNHLESEQKYATLPNFCSVFM